MNTGVPVLKEIVLLGGGHSHALLVRRWGMKPLAGVRLTLISRDVLTPYSGMLPGYISGHYSSDDIHLDLSRLCRWADVRFIEATITGLNLDSQQVMLADRPALGYDVLSIDTGSTPDTASVSGAAEHAIPVKPIHLLEVRLQAFLSRLETRQQPVEIGIVGSGVGGFELLLALDHRLKARKQDFTLHWILRGEVPIKSRPPKAQRLALEACRERHIQVHTGFDVTTVRANGLDAADGRFLQLDEIFWCTAAAAAPWPGQAGLATDKKGFIATNAFLQSVSHSNVFASGDIGTQLETPSEKAGVFAVRQAPVLFHNLRRFVCGQSLKVYRPQKETLSLMALGNKSAIATRGRLSFRGDWVWRWKDYIDQSFMNKFSALPERRMLALTHSMIPAALRNEAKIDLHSPRSLIRCGGCGSKIPADVLGAVLRRLQITQREDVLVGLDQADDAAVIRTSGQAMVQSVDQFRAMLADPFLFGRITALHALSDLFAMAAEPQSAQALITLPQASARITEDELFQLMSGALLELNRHDCALIGGHSSEGSELVAGFAVNGWIDEARAKPASLQPGDSLILTKALGTGVLLSADMQAEAAGVDMQSCISSMLLSNQAGAAILARHCSAMTDVTGFGLLGHLLTLLQGSGLDCELSLQTLPLLPGAQSLCARGMHSTLLPANLRFLAQTDLPGVDADQAAAAEDLPVLSRLLCDPQTSGGLLAGVPAAAADECVAELRQAGLQASAVIGRVTQPGDGRVALLQASA